MNDSEFERILLQSAGGDAPPDEARDAWARLSGTLGTIGTSGTIGSGRLTGNGRREPEASLGPSIARDQVGFGNGARIVATKWLLLGAIGGSAVTAAVMIRAWPGRTEAPAAIVAERAAPSPAEVAGASSAPSPIPIPVAPLVAPTAHPRHAGRGRDDRARQDAGSPKASASALAAEVARIDAARTANASGEYDEAIWLIDRYHRDFPDGALAPDAEVVALEAVAAKRDRPETARRAALFLSRYPEDPHAARVKWLTDHRGTDQQ